MSELIVLMSVGSFPGSGFLGVGGVGVGWDGAAEEEGGG